MNVCASTSGCLYICMSAYNAWCIVISSYLFKLLHLSESAAQQILSFNNVMHKFQASKQQKSTGRVSVIPQETKPLNTDVRRCAIAIAILEES